jgi:hypothetical protein
VTDLREAVRLALLAWDNGEELSAAMRNLRVAYAREKEIDRHTLEIVYSMGRADERREGNK